MPETTFLIDKAINKMQYMFLVAGVNIKIGEKTLEDKYKAVSIHIFNFIWLNTDIAGAMLWFYQGLLENRRFTELTYVAPCIITSWLSSIKAYYLVTKEETAELLIEKLRKLETDQLRREENADTNTIIANDEDFLNKVIKFLSILNILLMISFALTPLTLVLLDYLNSGEVKLQLPFLIVYPFDAFDLRYYPWVYLKQIWSEIVVILSLCTTDFVFFIFCSYLRIQFRLLRYYLENLLVTDSRDQILSDTAEIKSKLVELIKWHQELKSCVDLLETLFTRPMFFNFISSSMLICLTGFDVMAIDDVAFVLTFLCFLSMSLLQIFFLCFFGDLLMESSIIVGDGIYNSKWYIADKSLGKSLLLIQTRSQLPCKLTASKFAVVNLKAFMKTASQLFPDMPETTFLIDKAINKMQYMFLVAGVNIKIGEKTLEDKYKAVSIHIFNFIWLNTDIAGAMLWFYQGLLENRRFTELTYVAPCIITSWLSSIKAYYLVTKEETAELLIEKLRKLETDQLRREENADTNTIIANDEDFLNKVIKFLSILNILLMISFALTPLTLVLLDYLNSGEVKLQLPFLIVYPFDAFDLRYYPWVYLKQIWSASQLFPDMPETTFLIDKAINKMQYMFLVAGVNIKIGEKTLEDKYKAVSIHIFNFIWLNTDIAGAMLWFYQGLLENRRFTELTYVAPCIITSWLSSIKAYYLVTKEETAELLIEKLRKLETDQLRREENADTNTIIANDEDFLNKVIKFLSILNILLMISFALTPLTLVLLDYLNSGEVKLQLPFLIVYPFDAFDLRYYPWVYLKQIWSEIVVILSLCTTDFVFFIFCSYLRIQFRLLRYYLENLLVTDSRDQILSDTAEIKSKLVELIKWHQELKSCVDLLETLFTRPMFFNFISSSMLICLTGFDVMAIDDVAFVLTFLCFLSMSLLQIFFLCFFGDLLMESSIIVGDGIYNSKWYIADKSLGKSLLLIQTRSQLPCKLTASKFAVVNLKAFMKTASQLFPDMPETTFLIDKAINKMQYMFLVAGVNIKIGEKTLEDKYKAVSIHIFNFIWLNTDIAGAMLWFYQGLLENRRFTELTYVAPCIITSWLSSIKAYYLVTKEETAELLIEKLRKLETDQLRREENADTNTIIANDEDFLNKVIKFLSILNILLMISFALTPLTLVLLDYLNSGEVKLQLPFLIVYPFDAFDLRYYPWVYLKQIWSEIVVILSLCTTDFVFFIFCSYLRIQFRLLRYYLENLLVTDSRDQILSDTAEIKSKLVELIKWHQELKSCVDLLETLFTRPMFFNFISSSMLICLTGFDVMAIDDVAFVLTFLCFLSMSLLQIFFLCFFGDLLMESSIIVGDGIYNSKWYIADKSLGKSLLLIQTRSQLPCKLTASKFAVVNLKAFMKICSSAWSYFALLQTMYTGPDK